MDIEAFRQEMNLDPRQPVLLTLSRISPEKGQHLLLEALRLWETEPGFPEPVRVPSRRVVPQSSDSHGT
mgnify:CR=1 FL=1